jgi:hypothetical protein
MDMYGMEIHAETRLRQQLEDADIRRLLRAARAASGEADGTAGRFGVWPRRGQRPATSRLTTPLAEAS